MTNSTIAATAALASLVGAGVGCAADGLETSSFDQALIEDGTATYGTPGFYFSPPLVDAVVTGGPFDGGYAARLTIDLAEVDCGNAGIVGATVHTFSTVQVVPLTERYRVSFTDIGAVGLQNDHCYRIIPKLDGAPLGYRDMLVSDTPGDPPAGYKKWGTGGGAKSIAFRLEDLDPDADGVLSHVDNCDYDPAPSTSISVPGQVAAYTGDGTAAAAIGGVDGAWTGTEAYVPGAVGDAFAFDTASTVDAPGLNVGGDWTLQLWARANAIQPRNTGLVSAGDADHKPDTFQIDWNAFGGYRFSAGNGSVFNRSFGAASTAAFQHLVVTQAGGSYRLYLDGVEVEDGTYLPLLIRDIRLGTNRGKLRYDGAIDDVRVWSRALAAAEVAAIHASSAAGVCN
jgi:hypothetical protein